MNANIDFEDMYTPEEVAIILKTDVSVVYDLIYEYGLKVFPLDEEGTFRIPKSCLLEHIVTEVIDFTEGRFDNGQK